MKKYIAYLWVVAVVMSLAACDAINLDEVEPRNSIPVSAGINDKKTADALLAGVYDAMQADILNTDAFLGLSQIYSDEAIFTGTFPSRFEFANLNITTSNNRISGIFTAFYDVINRANNVIEIIPGVQDDTYTDADKNSAVAQARFMRGLCYFYLANYFGDVPLILTPTRSVAPDVINVPNNPKADVIKQVIDDLEFAESNLAGGDPFTATSGGATALLARVYLYESDWANAAAKAQQVLGAGFNLTQFAYMTDIIYGIGFSPADGNILNFWYSVDACGGRHDFEPSAKFLASYELGDLRRSQTVLEAGQLLTPCGLTDFATQPFVIKYDDFASAGSGTATDPVLMIRHAEMVLIAAEAAAQQGSYAEAGAWLNQVRARAGLAPVTVTAGNFLDLILQERFIELAFEGNHRYMDLRRSGRAAAEISGYQPCNDIWPLPQREIDRNPNLTQNNCCNC